MITSDNFIEKAFACYDNPQCFSMKEFEVDIRRFTVLKILLYRHRYKKDLVERLILNHIIVLLNVFNEMCVELLFFKLPEYKSELTTFLIYLNRMPEKINNIYTSDIRLDDMIISRLRKI